MKKTLRFILNGAVSLSLLSACGATASLSSATGSDQLQALHFAADAGEMGPGFATVGRPGAPGQRPDKMGAPGREAKGGGFAPFLQGLDLTAEQQSALQAIQSELRSQMESSKPAADSREAMQAQIAAAFTSEEFDADALHASVEANAPDRSAVEQGRAEALVKSWAVLTAEQQSTVLAHVAERAAAQSERPERPEHPEGSPPWAAQLNLSADQEAALQAALEADRPDKAERPDPSVLVNALAEGASASEIVALQARPEHNPLERLATLHRILSPEQRQSFVDGGFLNMGPKGRGPGGQAHMSAGKAGFKGGKMGRGGRPGGPGFGPGFGPSEGADMPPLPEADSVDSYY